MMFRPLLIAGSLAALAACAAETEAPSPSAASANEPGVCDEAAWAWLVGESWEEARPRVEARTEAENLTLRALGSGDPMTMDYRMDRLTVVFTDKGVVESADCV